jgi:polysaccharide biosynthesis/export protein
MLHPLRFSIRRSAATAFVLLLAAAGLFGQDRPQTPPPAPQTAPSGYLLRPGDVMSIQAPDIAGLADAPFAVSEDGYINLPQVGRIGVAGLTIAQVEARIVEQLKPFVRSPQAYARILRFHSEYVVLIGAFVRPGTYPYEPNRKLTELLSIAGGLSPNANRIVRVTRQLQFGPIPHTRARAHDDRGVSEVEIDVRRLIETINSPEDLVLRPSDVIAAVLKERIYVSGMVARPGALELEDRDFLTVSQAISIAGLGPDAGLDKTVVLRPIENTNRRATIPVNLKRVLRGQERDFPLLPNDVLVVPPKTAWGTRILSYAVPAAASGAIFALLRTR